MNVEFASFFELLELIASTAAAVDPTCPCEAACHRGLERIAATVDYVTYANLANINEAMRGGLMSVIEVHLMCVGGGPTLDFQDAADFLAGFQPAIDAALTRLLQQEATVDRSANGEKVPSMHCRDPGHLLVDRIAPASASGHGGSASESGRGSTRSVTIIPMAFRPMTCRSSTSLGNCCARTASMNRWRRRS